MVSKKTNSNSMVIESRPSALREAYKNILSELRNYNFKDDDIFSVHLALEEAFANAVRHGNKMDPARKVKIDYSVSSDRIEISVTDEGNGFNPGIIPDPRYGENLYMPSGRGLFLIQSYMNEVEFNDCGNSVRMVKFKQAGD